MTCQTCGGATRKIHLGFTSLVVNHCPACAERLHVEAVTADEQRAAADLLHRAGVTPRLREWDLISYPEADGGEQAKEIAYAWLDEYRRDGIAPNLYLWGPAGSGKTGLAWGIVRDLLRDEFRRAKRERDADCLDKMVTRLPAMLLDARAYLDDARDRIAKSQARDRTPERVPVLVLDDLGSERDTAWAVEQLGLIVAQRYDHRLPLIVTSNYSPEHAAQRLSSHGTADGERLLSRVCDSARIVRIGAADRRIAR